MGIPQSVYPYIYSFVALQVGYEACKFANSIRDSVDKFTILNSRVSHCPAERLSCEIFILIFIRIEISLIFIDHVVDVIDCGFCHDYQHCGVNRTDDGKDEDPDLENGEQDFQSGFHSYYLQVYY